VRTRVAFPSVGGTGPTRPWGTGRAARTRSPRTAPRVVQATAFSSRRADAETMAGSTYLISTPDWARHHSAQGRRRLGRGRTLEQASADPMDCADHRSSRRIDPGAESAMAWAAISFRFNGPSRAPEGSGTTTRAAVCGREHGEYRRAVNESAKADWTFAGTQVGETVVCAGGASAAAPNDLAVRIARTRAGAGCAASFRPSTGVGIENHRHRTRGPILLHLLREP